MDNVKRKVFIYTLIKQLNVPKEEEEIFKSKLNNIIPFYLYLKKEDENFKEYLERMWSSEFLYPFDYELILNYIETNHYSYLNVTRHGGLEQLNLNALYYILIDQSVRLWLVKSSSHAEFKNFETYYEWVNILFVNKERLEYIFKKSTINYVKKDYQLCKNIYSNKEYYIQQLYKVAKSRFIQMYLKNDNQETPEILPIFSHYENLLIQIDELREQNKLKDKALSDLNEFIKTQEVKLIENMMNQIENSKYDFPLTKLFSILNEGQVDYNDLQTTILNLYVAMNQYGLKTQMKPNEGTYVCLGWKLHELELIPVVNKGSV